MKHNLTVYNLGCTHEEEQLFWWGIEHAWNPLKTPTKRKAKNIPILLVNETQMDAIYPPERRRFLDPETLPRWAQERSERLERGERKEIHEAEEDPLRGLRDTPHLWEEYKIVVAAGLYVSDLKSHLSALYSITPYNLLKPLESLQDRFPTHPKNPAIFLCLKRIFKWAERAGVDECFVLSKVYYHELGHALMDTGHTPYDTLWGRLIEESLANWYAFGYFRNKFPHNEWFRLLVEEQPIEYQGCWFLSSKIMLYWMQCKKDNEFINKTIEYFWKKKVKQLLFLHHLITLLRETLIKKEGALRSRLISTLLNSNFAKAIKDAIGEDNIIVQVEAHDVFPYGKTGDSISLGLELSLLPQKESIAQALSRVLSDAAFTVTFILTPTQEEGKEPQSTLLIKIKPAPQAGFLLRTLQEKTVEIPNFNKDVLPEVENTVVSGLSELLQEAAQQAGATTGANILALSVLSVFAEIPQQVDPPQTMQDDFAQKKHLIPFVADYVSFDTLESGIIASWELVLEILEKIKEQKKKEAKGEKPTPPPFKTQEEKDLFDVLSAVIDMSGGYFKKARETIKNSIRRVSISLSVLQTPTFSSYEVREQKEQATERGDIAYTILLPDFSANHLIFTVNIDATIYLMTVTFTLWIARIDCAKKGDNITFVVFARPKDIIGIAVCDNWRMEKVLSGDDISYRNLITPALDLAKVTQSPGEIVQIFANMLLGWSIPESRVRSYEIHYEILYPVLGAKALDMALKEYRGSGLPQAGGGAAGTP